MNRLSERKFRFLKTFHFPDSLEALLNRDLNGHVKIDGRFDRCNEPGRSIRFSQQWQFLGATKS